MKSPSTADAGASNPEAAADPDRPPLLSIDSAIFKEVRVSLEAKLGQATLSVEDLLALRPGSTVKLDTRTSELVEVHLNNALVARGEIVAIGDQFGIRLVEIAKLP